MTSEDDEYDRYFEDADLIHLQSEATALDGDEGQGGTEYVYSSVSPGVSLSISFC